MDMKTKRVVDDLRIDGAPVGGLSDQTRWICGRITTADPTGRSGCWFMRENSLTCATLVSATSRL